MSLEHGIIDTFPGFLSWWRQYKDASRKDQLESWSSVYMAAWPELRQKQIEQYASEGSDWQQVAAEHVFPGLNERLAAMQIAHENLLVEVEPVLSLVRQRLGDFQSPQVVVYVGLGLGAGWATDYLCESALLFGLENIAEKGWQGAATLRGLIAHELGHLLHEEWRGQANMGFGEGPLWQLYTEGFAQRCEQQVEGGESWHMNAGSEDAGEWLTWCQGHRPWLASEFLRRLDEGEDVRAFFGSWFDIQGMKQTGYFLGCELIKQLELDHSLLQVACLKDVEDGFRKGLQSMACLNQA